MDFEEANKKEHPVEKQWHYPKVTAAGFVPQTLIATGFVRSYKYSKGDIVLTCSTGVHSDHWSSNDGCYGLHKELQFYLDTH